MNDDLNTLIQQRLNKAKDTLEAAKLLAEKSHWISASNRLFYSAFYAVLALLAATRTKTSTHSGAKSQFYKIYIKTGIIDRRFGELYTDLYNKRQEGDYDDFTDFTEPDIRPLISQVEEFIQLLESHINKTE